MRMHIFLQMRVLLWRVSGCGAETHILFIKRLTSAVVCGLQLYRGTLQEAEDNMNCSMTNVTMTGRDGSITTLEQVFIRGGLISFVIIPDILKNAPMFKRIDPKQGILRGKGVGIGRATVNRARSVCLSTFSSKPGTHTRAWRLLASLRASAWRSGLRFLRVEPVC